jgi:hypothetical protein
VHNPAIDISASPITGLLLTKDTGPPGIIAIAVPLMPQGRQRTEPHHSLMFKAGADLSSGGVFRFVTVAAAENGGRGYECARGAVLSSAPSGRPRLEVNARKRTHVQPVALDCRCPFALRGTAVALMPHVGAITPGA